MSRISIPRANEGDPLSAQAWRAMRGGAQRDTVPTHGISTDLGTTHHQRPKVIPPRLFELTEDMLHEDDSGDFPTGTSEYPDVRYANNAKPVVHDLGANAYIIDPTDIFTTIYETGVKSGGMDQTDAKYVEGDRVWCQWNRKSKRWEFQQVPPSVDDPDDPVIANCTDSLAIGDIGATQFTSLAIEELNLFDSTHFSLSNTELTIKEQGEYLWGFIVRAAFKPTGVALSALNGISIEAVFTGAGWLTSSFADPLSAKIHIPVKRHSLAVGATWASPIFETRSLSGLYQAFVDDNTVSFNMLCDGADFAQFGINMYFWIKSMGPAPVP